MDELDGAHVQPARRLGGDEEPDGAGELSRDHHLLLVAAGEAAHPRVDAGRAYIEFIYQGFGIVLYGRLVHADTMGEGELVVGGEDEVVGNGEGCHQAIAQPVLRDVGHALLDNTPRRRVGGITAQDLHLAAECGPQPSQHLYQLRLAVALDTSDPQDLPSPNLKGDPINRQAAPVIHHQQVFHTQHHFSRLGRCLVHREDHLAAYHHGRQRCLGRLIGCCRAHHVPVTQHRDAVGDGENLLEFVGDEDDGLALGSERTHNGE